jgi:hypothetical protein
MRPQLNSGTWTGSDMTANTAFLESVDALNEKFNSVDLGGHVEPLVHSFWTASEIRSAIGSLRADWEVPLHLIPFYGDWHTLLCLDEASGAIVYLNDARTELFRWRSPQEFLAPLRSRPDESAQPAQSEDVLVTLDPSLQALDASRGRGSDPHVE